MASSSSPSEQFDRLYQMAVEHFWPHSQQVAELSQPGGLHVVEKGEGCWVEDIQGNRYFDLISGMQLQNVGYGRKEIAEAVYEQLVKISYAPEHTTSEPAIRLSDRLAALAPDKDSRVFLVSGGSEGIETALKMAKKYHKLRGEPGRYKVISRTGSYHGGTLATISLGGGAGAGDKDFGPLMPGNVHISMPNPYRCLYCSQRGECTLECGQDVERAILDEGPELVAAFVAEPLSAATCTVPHPDYWPTVRSICDRYGVLIIADEVVTGFGRTGKMFASDHWGLVPDILVGAKGLSSGYQPIGAAIASKHVADTFIGGDREMFRHIFHLWRPSRCLRRRPGEPGHPGTGRLGRELRDNGVIPVRSAPDTVRASHSRGRAGGSRVALRNRAGQGSGHERAVPCRRQPGAKGHGSVSTPRALGSPEGRHHIPDSSPDRYA